jgi:glycosyltransferase involved in cell wall biosynthesis
MIYFCLPAYNEAATVGLSIYRIGEVMKQVNREYELIVLDDGSTDETHQVVDSYERLLPIRLIGFESNRGFGPSLLCLLKEVVRRSIFPERDILVTIEADFSQNPSVVPEMVREIEGGADLVIASAFARGSRIINTPLRFKVLNSMFYILFRNLYSVRGVKDYVSSFRAYRVGLLKRGLEQMDDEIVTLKGRSANTELLLNLNRLNPHIVEVPLLYRHDIRKRESRNHLHEVWWEYIRMISRLWLGRR